MPAGLTGDGVSIEKRLSDGVADGAASRGRHDTAAVSAADRAAAIKAMALTVFHVRVLLPPRATRPVADVVLSDKALSANARSRAD
jgi:hypothetical protein